jgi:tRNA (guanine-N7-)-methyltransferase
VPITPYADAPRLPAGDGIDPRDLLGDRAGPVELEIGPGRGGFLTERLVELPELCMIGLEIRRKWASIVDDRLRRRGLGDRARVFAEDARDALPRFVEAGFSAVFIHFPDPWWKKRHHKRLLVTDSLVRQLARVLRPGGELFVQTDVAERADAYQEVIEGVGWFASWEGGGRLATSPHLAQSPRERRVVGDGLPVHRLRYRRTAP